MFQKYRVVITGPGRFAVLSPHGKTISNMHVTALSAMAAIRRDMQQRQNDDAARLTVEHQRDQPPAPTGLLAVALSVLAEWGF